MVPAPIMPSGEKEIQARNAEALLEPPSGLPQEKDKPPRKASLKKAQAQGEPMSPGSPNKSRENTRQGVHQKSAAAISEEIPPIGEPHCQNQNRDHSPGARGILPFAGEALDQTMDGTPKDFLPRQRRSNDDDVDEPCRRAVHVLSPIQDQEMGRGDQGVARVPEPSPAWVGLSRGTNIPPSAEPLNPRAPERFPCLRALEDVQGTTRRIQAQPSLEELPKAMCRAAPHQERWEEQETNEDQGETLNP